MADNTNLNIAFVCSKCEHTTNTNVKTRVENDKDWAEIEKIYDGSFFVRKCEKCGEKVVVNFPVGYHNMQSGKEIMFLPMNFNAQTEEIETPSSARITHDMLAFIEKVRIAEMDLDDKIVELVKIVAYNQVAELGKVPDEALEGIGCWIKDDKSLDLNLRCGGRHYLLEVPYQMYLDVEEKLRDILSGMQEPKVVDLNWALMVLNALIIEEDEETQSTDNDDWDEIIF